MFNSVQASSTLHLLQSVLGSNSAKDVGNNINTLDNISNPTNQQLKQAFIQLLGFRYILGHSCKSSSSLFFFSLKLCIYYCTNTAEWYQCGFSQDLNTQRHKMADRICVIIFRVHI